MKISDADGVRTVTFDRPGVMNAVTVETATELAETIEDVDAETHDAVVLTGEGAAFSAGGDIETMVDTEANAVETFDGIAETFGRVVEAAITSRVPIVAKVNGDAVGAGLALAALSDFAYAADSATFSCAFVRVGLIPDTGGTFLLPQLVGLRTAKRLAMTGEFISADEAADIDLINEVAWRGSGNPDTISTSFRQTHPFREDSWEDDFPHYKDSTGPELEEARAVLEDAGWGWDDDGNLRYPSDADTSEMWPSGSQPNENPDDWECINEEGELEF
jgi:2-(1,2-epoxy-1,2-dihydrophenyl)acetyl-CoA isomerase